MKVSIRDLGVLKQADFEVGNLTVICGENNTGKTYATYALYGFLHYWNSVHEFDFVNEDDIISLLQHGELFIKADKNFLDNYVKQASGKVTLNIASFLGSAEKNFSNASISVTRKGFTTREIHDVRTIANTKGETISMKIVKKDADEIVQLTVKSKSPEISEENSYGMHFHVNRLIENVLIHDFFPHPFIASIERTGAVMFQKELDIRRNQLLERINEAKSITNFELLSAVNDARYALPVRHDIDFIRDLEYSSKFDSAISKKRPDIVEFFNLMAGGQYVTTKEGTYFSPTKSRMRLAMGESASSVRSLLNLGMFIKHLAQPGSLLMIDEPELNLHPKNQRMMARLLARLVNAGIKVYITTHSDYIIREFNTLIMMKSKGQAAKRIMEKHGYTEDELLDISHIKAYRARHERIDVEGRKSKKLCNVIVPAMVDEQGIEIEEIDDTINRMNEVQDAVIFCEANHD